MEFLQGGPLAMAYNRTIHPILADERKVGPPLADDVWQGLDSLSNYVKGVTDASANIAARVPPDTRPPPARVAVGVLDHPAVPKKLKVFPPPKLTVTQIQCACWRISI